MGQELIEEMKVYDFVDYVVGLSRLELQREFQTRTHATEQLMACEDYIFTRFNHNISEVYIGYTSFSVDLANQEIGWRVCYPLIGIKDSWEFGAEQLKRKGIGTLATITALSSLAFNLNIDLTDENYSVLHNCVSDERIGQLQGVGIEKDCDRPEIFEESLPTYYQKWLNYANSKGFHFEIPQENVGGLMVA